MEEKNNAKEVKMNVSPSTEETSQKQPELTYEQLKDACSKVLQENQYLKQQLQKAVEVVRTVDRLGYLFKVVDVANTGTVYKFTDDFVMKCIAEIESTLTIPETEENQKKEAN